MFLIQNIFRYILQNDIVYCFRLTWFCLQGDLSDHFAKFVTTISGVKQLKPLTNGQMKILRNIILASALYDCTIILSSCYSRLLLLQVYQRDKF